MDEILRQPKENTAVCETIEHRAAEVGSGLTEHFRRIFRAAAAAAAGAAALCGKVRECALRIDGAAAGRKYVGPLPFLAVAGVAGAALVIGTVYMPGYVVTANGIDLGTVTEPAVFERVVDRVEQRASDVLGYAYTLDQEIAYQPVLLQQEKLSPVSSFETYLFNQIGEVMKTYTLTVDGEFIGAGSKEDLDAMLDRLAQPYVTENTVAVEFVEDVQFAYEYISSDVQQDLTVMEEILSENINGETSYEVVGGDTYSGIAYANDMSLKELMALNPQASLDRLMIGDVLTVRQTIPYLSVRTFEEVSYLESIPCPVEEVEDDSMYQGQTKVLTAGEPGEAFVEARVSYVNGYEEGREVQSSVTLREPTVEVKAVGTKPRPKTMPTGTFQWPLSGRITSSFGYRTIFGSYSYHSGLDIAAPYGTAITASDGGTVVFSGYKGSYGNLIIVDHGSGIQTYYAHCSSLLVSSGAKVYKGQTIARVGSTGRSTGNHCHFEVKINGSSVNPLSYLP